MVLETEFQRTEPIEPQLLVVVLGAERPVRLSVLEDARRIDEGPLAEQGRVDRGHHFMHSFEIGGPELDGLGMPQERQLIAGIDPGRVGEPLDASRGGRVEILLDAAQSAIGVSLEPNRLAIQARGDVAEGFLDAHSDLVELRRLLGVSQRHHVLHGVVAVGQQEPRTRVGDEVVHAHGEAGPGFRVAFHPQQGRQVIEVRPGQLARRQVGRAAQHNFRQLTGNVGWSGIRRDVWREGGIRRAANLYGRGEVNGVDLEIIAGVHFRQLLEALHDPGDLLARTGVVAKLGQAEQLRLQSHLLHVMAPTSRSKRYVNPRRVTGVVALSGGDRLPAVLEVGLPDFDAIRKVSIARPQFPNLGLVPTQERRIERFPVLEESFIVHGGLCRQIRA